MPKPFAMLGGCLCLLFLSLSAGPARAEQGEELFKKLCSSCHTLGGGGGAGPDLKGVTDKHPSDWLLRVITEPDKLAAEKDPEQLALIQKYGMQMPNLGVSREDAEKIVAFLKGGEGAPAAKEEEAPAAAPVVVTPALLSAGRALFTGATPFSGGGPPCVSCHDLHYPGVHGGALAADLTGSYARMGASGVRGVLQSLSFPVMNRIYQGRPLNQGETVALAALFKDASDRNQERRNVFPFAVAGFFVLFIVVALMIKRRIR